MQHTEKRKIEPQSFTAQGLRVTVVFTEQAPPLQQALFEALRTFPEISAGVHGEIRATMKSDENGTR